MKIEANEVKCSHKKVNQGRKLSKLADDDENALENNVPFSKNIYPIWVIIK